MKTSASVKTLENEIKRLNCDIILASGTSLIALAPFFSNLINLLEVIESVEDADLIEIIDNKLEHMTSTIENTCAVLATELRSILMERRVKKHKKKVVKR